MTRATLLASILLPAALWAGELENARDRQDQAALQAAIQQLTAQAQKQPNDATAQYRLAVARSYLAEVAMEKQDKGKARTLAEDGIQAAQRAVELKGQVAEHHRVLGTLCGQSISAAGLAGLKHGRCALDEINKAIELDPKSAIAYTSRGVGYYYLPTAFGGGIDPALRDLDKALQLDPKSAETYLWKGVVLRKANRLPEAREALAKSLELNPRRAWTKEQLEKIPGK